MYVSETKISRKTSLFILIMILITSLIGLIYFSIFFKSKLQKINALITDHYCDIRNRTRSCRYDEQRRRNFCTNSYPLQLTVKFQFLGKKYENIVIHTQSKSCNSYLNKGNIYIYIDPKDPYNPKLHGNPKIVLIIICLLIFLISLISIITHYKKNNKY